MIDMMLKGGMMDTMRWIVSIHYLLVMITLHVLMTYEERCDNDDW